jgi:hypothetical protein
MTIFIARLIGVYYFGAVKKTALCNWFLGLAPLQYGVQSQGLNLN